MNLGNIKTTTNDILNQINQQKPQNNLLLSESEKVLEEKYLRELFRKFVNIYCDEIEEKNLDRDEIEEKINDMKENIDFIKFESYEELEETYVEWEDLIEGLYEVVYQVRIGDKIYLEKTKEEVLSDHGDIGKLGYGTDFNFEISKNIDLPEDMKLFYQMYGNGLELKKLNNKPNNDKYPIFYKLEKFEIFYISYLESNGSEFITYQNLHGIAHININDWFIILFDKNSVDNGAGTLIINLNKDSPFFGNILATSSGDDGTLNLVALSFTELIELLIKEPVHILINNDKDVNCISLCDHLNQFCKNVTCWKNNKNKILEEYDEKVFNYERT